MVRIKLFFILCFFCVLGGGFAEESENFIVSEKNHNNLVYTYFTEDSLVRKEYDEKKRLILKITWDIKTEELVSKISYSYNEKSLFPFYSESVYDLESRVEKIDYYENGKKKKVEILKDDIKLSEENYKYDEEGRILSLIKKEYKPIFSEKENFSKESQLIKESETQYQYVVFDSKIFTNKFYFENKQKLTETIYLSPTKYYENTFFEGDFRIYAEYENNKKILEITYLHDKEVRRR